jgi:hypothetical protein
MAKIGEKLWKIHKKCPLNGHFGDLLVNFKINELGYFFRG